MNITKYPAIIKDFAAYLYHCYVYSLIQNSSIKHYDKSEVRNQDAEYIN